jgi:squalene cyclase
MYRIPILGFILILIIGLAIVLSGPGSIEISEYQNEDNTLYTVTNNTKNWVEIINDSGYRHYLETGESLTFTLTQGKGGLMITEIINPTQIIGNMELVEGKYYICLKQSHCPDEPGWTIGEPFTMTSIILGNHGA